MTERTKTAPPAPAHGTTASPPLHALFSHWTPEQIDLIRRTIAPSATDHELALYLHVCKAYGLDPLRRELVMQFRADEGGRRRPVFITTRDAYLKIAMRDPGYAGIESGVVCEGDHFEFNTGRRTIVHSFGAKRGQILGAWAIARHASRPPVMVFVPFNEYFDPASPTWRRHPTAMIQKVAEVAALRRQYAVGHDIVSREEVSHEFPDRDEDDPHATATIAPPPQAIPAPDGARDDAAQRPGTQPQAADSHSILAEERESRLSLLSRAARLAGYTGPHYVRAWLRDTYGIDASSVDDVPEDMIEQIVADAAALAEAPAAQKEGESQSPPPPAAAETDTTTADLGDVPGEHGSAPGSQPASSDQVARILDAFRALHIGESEQRGLMRTILGAAVASPRDLTAEQADRIIRALAYLQPRARRTGPPA